MNIVLDANILFSALIKNSKTRELIIKYEDFFLFPSYIFIEMEKHKSELLIKSKMQENEFNCLLQILLKRVIIIPNEKLIPYRKEAYDIIKDIDPNDAIFIASALAYSNSFLWTDDKKLKKQNRVNILETKDMIRLIEDK